MKFTEGSKVNRAKLRVCVVTPAPLGQTETFIKAHLDRLPHSIVHIHGYNLEYTSKGQKLSDWYLQKYARDRRWLNLLPRFIEFRIRKRFFAPPSSFDIVRLFLLQNRFDVVLAEYGTAASFIAPVCKSTRIPLVAHFHGFDASRTRITTEFASGYKNMFEYASSVISVSAPMSKALEGLGCDPGKIRMNPYGPDPKFFAIKPDYSSNTLIAVGRQTHKKAPYLTLDAFRLAQRSCPELKLCMIGDGELLEVSDRLIKAWGLTDKVELLGSASPDKVREKMGSSFAFLQHSVEAHDGDSEGMPVAVLEAAAAGLPVVSTRHAGIPEAVVDEVTGFISEPGNSEDMSDRIVELSNRRELAKQMGEAGRCRVRECFSMSRHLEVLDKILIDASRLECKE